MTIGLIRNPLLALAIVGTLGLWGCLPEQKDPAAISNAGKLDGNYYAASLANLALKIQNLVVSDSTWFEAIDSGQELDLAALGLTTNGLFGTLKSHVCPSVPGTEVVQVTWIDSRDSNGKFALKGVGSDTGRIVTSLRSRVSSDQVGVFAGGSSMMMSNGQAASLPKSCASLAIPVGTPVLTFNIDRPAAPRSELARTEYRTVACGPDLSGKERQGTMIESRVVRYLSDGTITPSDPDAGWTAENLGQCIDSVSIEIANRTTVEGGGTAVLNKFANNSLRQILMDQLKMDCVNVDVVSDMKKKTKDGAVLDQRERKTKHIDTCANVSPQGLDAVRDTDGATIYDSKRLTCGSKQASSRTFLSVVGQLSQRWDINHVTVVRGRKHAVVSDGSGPVQWNHGERDEWVGDDIACHGADVFDVACHNISGAPAAQPRQSHSKWTTVDANVHFFDEDWWSSVFNFCITDCTKVTGGYVEHLNKSYFTGTYNFDNRGTTVERSVNASSWKDAKEFEPNTNYGRWYITRNQCVWATRTVYQNCPFSYNGRQGNWYPATLSLTNPHPAALEPGVSASGRFSSDAYYSSLGKGDMPATAVIYWEECNIKGCDTRTSTDGPGTNAYIKAWRYGEASSVNGAGVTVQTTLLNKEGIELAHKPSIHPANTYLWYRQDGFAQPMHCGRGEERAISWPVIVQGKSSNCSDEGQDRWVNIPEIKCEDTWDTGYTTIYERHVREWYGYSYATGTWSRPITTYVTGCGSYPSLDSIPNPLPHGC